MPVFNRRDFLKLSGVAAAAVGFGVLSKKQDHIANLNTDSDFLKQFVKVTTTVDRVMDEETVNNLNMLFNVVANGVVELKNDEIVPLTDYEKEIIENFNEKHFVTRVGGMIDMMVRLQQVHDDYKKFDDIDDSLRMDIVSRIENDFNKINLAIDLFTNIVADNPGLTPKELAKKMLLDTVPLNSDGTPVDPFFGANTYDTEGMRHIFNHFIHKHDQNQTTGTYSITHNFLSSSGHEFYVLANASLLPVNNGDIPNERPKPYVDITGKNGLVEAVDPYGHNNNFKEIVVDDWILDDIRNEMSNLGLDRSFRSLGILGNNKLFGTDIRQMVFFSLGIDSLDKEIYLKEKKLIIFALVHETFHSLTGLDAGLGGTNNLDRLSDFDRCYIDGVFRSLYKNTCSYFSGQVIFDEKRTPKSIARAANHGGIEFIEGMVTSVNESYRNRYVHDFLLLSSPKILEDTIYFLRDNLGVVFNSPYFDNSADDVVRDYPDMLEFAKNNIDNFANEHTNGELINNVKMSNVERFILTKINNQLENGTIFSEASLSLMYNSEYTIDDYLHRNLPGVIILASILRGDGEFVDAIKKDINDTEKSDIAKKRLFSLVESMRKEYDFGNNNRCMNEYLADQWAFSFVDFLKYDDNNTESANISREIIAQYRQVYVDILNFFVKNKLAKNNVGLV
ncbi:MAG: twin-arginine translocation signal domain-containing protein [Candidatus Shapirobacteria bacterium]